MKNLAAAMLLTGFSFLTACGANQTGYAGSGQSSDAMSEADVQTSAAESDAAASEETELLYAESYSLPDLCSFTARTLDGGSFTAADLSGADVTVINIWQTSCGPCIREMPEIAEFAATLPDSVRVMTWCLDADYSPDSQQLSDFMQECKFTGITLTSGDGDMQTLLEQLMYTPTTVFLDSSGHQLCEPLIGAGNVAEQYTEHINAGLKKLGKDQIL